VFDCDGRFIVVLVPGDRRVDADKLRHAVGCTHVRPATPEQVSSVTGYPAGGVAPFPLVGVERVLVDPSLLAHRVVWIGAGSARHIAALNPLELVRLARAQPVDLVSRD
jgi:prolyl-tRNA editing enzyme YbaK/EbsC (Cys-tRNA(Pro) deacylase)